jgi:hypothetical protein
MLARLKAKKAEITRLREERGATDPILIIAGIAITLILLVGGSFAISGFIANANNLNAKGDLDRVATAQAAFLAANDRYGNLAIGPNVSGASNELAESAIGFTPTAGNSIKVRTSPSGWTAVTKSASGDIFLRTSQSTQVHQLGTDADNPQYGAAQEDTRNLYRNPDAATSTDMNYWANASTVTTSNPAVSWSTNGRALRATYTTVGATFGGPTPYLGGSYVLGEKMTLAFKVFSTRAFNLNQPSIDQTGTGMTVTVHERSGSRAVPANTPTVVYVTFTATGTPAALAVSSMRLHSGLTGVISGQSIESSDFDLYAGDYQAGRTFFSGASADTVSTDYGWAGPANSSASIKSIRPIIANMPTGVSLPSGISWEQVGTDAAEVQ